MGRGITFAQIKKAVPDLDDTGRSEEMESLAGRVDKIESIEKFIKGEDGQAFRDHFVSEIASTMNLLFSSVSDHDKLIVIIARLQVMVNFYKMLSGVEANAEMMRELVFEMIDEIKVDRGEL